jgi:F0F1-type ATP synthase assembly protein I
MFVLADNGVFTWKHYFSNLIGNLLYGFLPEYGLSITIWWLIDLLLIGILAKCILKIRKRIPKTKSLCAEESKN